MGKAWRSLPDMLDRESEREVEAVKRRLMHVSAEQRGAASAAQPAAVAARRHRVA